jgi:hypothetical protein
MIQNKKMAVHFKNQAGCDKNRLQPILINYPSFYVKALMEITRTFTEGSRASSQDSNRGPIEWEAGC